MSSSVAADRMEESVAEAVAILHAAPPTMTPAVTSIGHPAERRPGTFPPSTVGDRFRWFMAARKAGMTPAPFVPDSVRAAREALAAVRGMAAAHLARMLDADVTPAPAGTSEARAARSTLRRRLASAAPNHAPPGGRRMTT